MKKLTTHHIIPKSLGGNNHFDNKCRLEQHRHRGLHMLHDNNLPHQQLSSIIDISGRSITKSFRDDILGVLQDYDLEQIYSHKCCNISKLVDKILNNNK